MHLAHTTTCTFQLPVSKVILVYQTFYHFKALLYIWYGFEFFFGFAILVRQEHKVASSY